MVTPGELINAVEKYGQRGASRILDIQRDVLQDRYKAAMAERGAIQERHAASRRAIHSAATMANGPYSEVISHLNSRWAEYNQEHFRGEMIAPLITLTTPKSRKSLAEYCPWSIAGTKAEICIRESIWTGRYKLVVWDKFKSENGIAGIYRLLDDILLHEMIHQYVDEIIDQHADGHGPIFTDECNRIGEKIGLVQISQEDSVCWPYIARKNMNDAEKYYFGTFSFDHHEIKKPSKTWLAKCALIWLDEINIADDDERGAFAKQKVIERLLELRSGCASAG